MMNIPKIYVNKIDKKIDNNTNIYYSYLDKSETDEIVYNEYEIQEKINNLFKSNNFVYKKKFTIKTKDGVSEEVIISKSYDYLLTIKGKKIYIKDILSID